MNKCGAVVGINLLKLFLLICFFPLLVFSQDTVPSVHYLTDYSNTIPEDKRDELEAILFGLEERSQIEFRIVITNDVGVQTPAEYTDQIWRDWHIGAREGQGLLLVLVKQNRSWALRATRSLTDEFPASEQQALGDKLALQIRSSGYAVAIVDFLREVVNKLGSSRGFNYEDLAQAKRLPADIPERMPNAAPPVPFLRFVGLALGLTLSVAGVVAIIGFGFATLSGIVSLFGAIFQKSVRKSHFIDLLKSVAGFALCGGAVYYFQESVKMYLGFGKLLGQGVAIFGACLFPIFGLVAFIVLIFLLKQGGRVWLRYVRTGREVLNKPIVITLCVPLLFLFLPKSEVTTLRSWSTKAGPWSQAGLGSSTLLGQSANTYTIDNFGRVRTITLRQGTASDLRELTGLTSLSALERLDIEGLPLEGTQDVSGFASLEVLRLAKTRIDGLQGLKSLPLLEDLEIENVKVENISELDQLSNLKKLALINCEINDVAILGRMTNLEALNLEGSSISSVAPLASLRKLHQLSVARTSIDDLSSIQHLPIIVLDVHDSKLNHAGIGKTFQHPMLVVHSELALSDGPLKLEQRFVPPQFRSLRNAVLLGLGAILLLFWLLKLLRRAQVYSLLVLQRVFKNTVWGGVLVLALVTLAKISLPVSFISASGLPDFPGAMLNWATIIAIGWLGLRPLLILLLETRFLNASKWSSITDFLVRYLPVILVFGPISYKLIRLSVPRDFYFIALVGFVMVVAIFGTPWLITGIVALVGMRNWRRRTRALKQLASSETPAIVEVPLRPSRKDVLHGRPKTVGLSLSQEGQPASVVASRTILTAVSAATLFRLPAGCAANVVATVITIPRSDLPSLRAWELKLIREWVESVYYETWSPIWLMSDWSETAQRSAASQKNVSALNELQPYLNGVEQRFKISTSIFPLEPETGIQQCLATNELISLEQLQSLSFDQLLRDAFLPVARLLRSVFGYPHVADRLDVLTRVTEMTVSFFALVLTAEYEARTECYSEADQQKIDGGLSWTFKRPPAFSGWVSLLLNFTNRSRTSLAKEIKRALEQAAPAATSRLETLVKQASGVDLTLTETAKTRIHSLELLRNVRNLLTAHGPVIERASPEVYGETLLVVLDLLTAMPWSSVSVCEVENGTALTYQGLRAKVLPTDGEQSGLGVQIYGETEGWFVDARKYFRGVNGSIAINLGEKGFFDPLTGLRV